MATLLSFGQMYRGRPMWVIFLAHGLFVRCGAQASKIPSRRTTASARMTSGRCCLGKDKSNSRRSGREGEEEVFAVVLLDVLRRGMKLYWYLVPPQPPVLAFMD